MRHLRERLPLVSTLFIVIVGSIFLLSQARYLWFFGDDWMFLLERNLSERPLHDLMAPHNEHWSTLPILIYRALFSVFGLQHYLVFALLPILAHAAACVLLFLVLRRARVNDWVAVAVATVMVFLGAGAENLLWAFQIGMIGTAVFGLGCLLLATDPPTRRSTGLIWLLSILSLMTASTAIPMLAWLGAFVLLGDGLRRALTLTAPPMLVWVLWFLVWGRHADTGLAKAALADVIPRMWRGLSATWDSMSGFAGVGPAVVVALIAASLAINVDTDRRRLALSGWMAALATYALFAWGRGDFGPDATTALRYAYFGALFMLASLALVLDALVSRLRQRPVQAGLTVAVLVSLLVVPGAFGVINFRKTRDAMTPDLRPRVLAASELIHSGETLLRQQIDPVWTASLTVDDLRPDSATQALPDDPIPPRANLTARAALQVGTSAESWDLPLARATFVGIEANGSDGCYIGLGATGGFVEIPSGPQGAEFRLTLSGVDRTTVRLRADGVTSLPVEMFVEDATEAYVGVTAPDVDLLVDLPPGAPFTVCGR